MSDLPSPFWSAVTADLRWRYLIFPHQVGVELVVQGVVVFALAAVLVGWRARAFAAVAALGLYHLAPLETIHWTATSYERGFEVAILSLVVLSASRCAAVWAVDRPRDREPNGRASDLRWPLVLIRLFVAQIFFFAGYAKLYRVGLDWVSAENMTRWLLLFAQQDQVVTLTALGPWIADRAWLAWLVAASAVVLDLSFLSTPFSRLARRILVPAAAVFHVGILLVMGIAFLNAPQLLVFVNWDWLRSRISSVSRARTVAVAAEA